MKTLELQNYINVGYIKKPLGLDGKFSAVINLEIKKPEDIAVDIGDQFIPFIVEDVLVENNFMVARVPHLKSIDAIKFIKGKSFYVDKKYLKNDDREVYEFIGYKIFDEENNELGIVADIMKNSLSFVLVLRNAEKKEVLIPYNIDLEIEKNISTKELVLKISGDDF